MDFFRNTKRFSSGRASFLALSTTGHAGAPAVHHGARVGPGRAPWRVFWAFEVAIIWQVTTGLLSTSQSQPGTCKPQMCACLFLHLSHAALEVPQQLSKARHVTTVAFQASLCDSHGRCFCVWVRERACGCVFAVVTVGSYSSRRNQEHSLKNRGAIQLFLLFFIVA